MTEVYVKGTSGNPPGEITFNTGQISTKNVNSEIGEIYEFYQHSTGSNVCKDQLNFLYQLHPKNNYNHRERSPYNYSSLGAMRYVNT